MATRSPIRSNLFRDGPLWILAQGSHRLYAELHRPRGSGWEVRLFHDGIFVYAERHRTRSLTIEEAENCCRELKALGWSTADQCDGNVHPVDTFQLEWLFGTEEESDTGMPPWF